MLKETPNDNLAINERLIKSPFSEKRIPSNEQISMIQASVNREKRKNKIPLWTAAGAIIGCLIVLFSLLYVNDMPGGLADWRMSRAIGLDGLNQIPIGRTPEEAIQKLQHYTAMQIIHEEPVKGGILLFIKREQTEDANLEIDYLRKTWLGWKWTWGGMFGNGGSMEGFKTSLSYMFMPKIPGIRTPFPIIYGDVLDPEIKSVIIVKKGPNSKKYSAKFAGSQTGHTIWFTYLPASFTVPYEIQALDANGDIVVSKTINEKNDSGQIQLPDK